MAIKLEIKGHEKQVLRLETAVLKKLQCMYLCTYSWLLLIYIACPFVARFYGCGIYGVYNFLVMELLGKNLSELRRQNGGRFSLTTTLQLGIHVVKILEEIHDLGLLHRDIKPSNFVIGALENKSKIYIIDFGLTKKFIDSDGQVRPPRLQCGFRGTARYASINSHFGRDLGRRDDLWSLLYMLVEFANGILPWKRLTSKDEIKDLKIKMNTHELVNGLPSEFKQFMDHISSLEFSDRPDYDYLSEILQKRLSILQEQEHVPFDWESDARGNNLNNSSSSQYNPFTNNTSVASQTVYKLVAGKRIDDHKQVQQDSTKSQNATSDKNSEEEKAFHSDDLHIEDETQPNVNDKDDVKNPSSTCKCSFL